MSKWPCLSSLLAEIHLCFQQQDCLLQRTVPCVVLMVGSGVKVVSVTLSPNVQVATVLPVVQLVGQTPLTSWLLQQTLIASTSSFLQLASLPGCLWAASLWLPPINTCICDIAYCQWEDKLSTYNYTTHVSFSTIILCLSQCHLEGIVRIIVCLPWLLPSFMQDIFSPTRSYWPRAFPGSHYWEWEPGNEAVISVMCFEWV